MLGSPPGSTIGNTFSVNNKQHLSKMVCFGLPIEPHKTILTTLSPYSHTSKLTKSQNPLCGVISVSSSAEVSTETQEHGTH